MMSSENIQAQLALDFIENTGVNIFLTGRAGTGKTTFLHNLRLHSHKRMVVVAPTGIAAINAKGMTIHSFFQLPFGMFLPNITRKSQEVRRFGKEKIKIIRSMELLVIDEISMVRADTLDAIDEVLKRFRRNSKPFGGVQLLMIGDLQQLAPVTTENEWQMLKNHYPTPYFFDSLVLKQKTYRTIELKHIYRQNDIDFINLLAKVRDGNIDSSTLNILNQRYNPMPQLEGYVTLSSHNYAAKRINDEKLRVLKSKEFSYRASIKNDFPESNYPVEEKLVLKKGAQVMFTRNDTEKNYVNGSIGEVTYLDNKTIKVRLLDTGQIIDVEQAEWENVKYSLDEESKEITETIAGTFTQYPLKTAWAITIHKSQGLTFDKVIIDAEYSFSHGQVYVALSRCRTLEGIILKSKIQLHSIKNDQNIKIFTKNIEDNPITTNQLSDDKKEYYENILLELFDFSSLGRNLQSVRSQLAQNLIKVYPKLCTLWGDKVESFNADIEKVAKQFQIQIKHLMSNENYLNDAHLQERINKGTNYFKNKCLEHIHPLLSTLNIEIDNKEVRKSINEGMQRIVDSYNIKIFTLTECCEQFSITNYLKAKASALTQDDEKQKSNKSKKTVDKIENPRTETITTTTSIDEIENQKLFNALKAWRREKASEINKPAFVVAHTKTLINITNGQPLSSSDLKKIHGIGEKFIENYGKDVLEIVTQYSNNNQLF